MKYLAGAIVFATLVTAFMFRYDYSHVGARIDRWTGSVDMLMPEGWVKQ